MYWCDDNVAKQGRKAQQKPITISLNFENVEKATGESGTF